MLYLTGECSYWSCFKHISLSNTPCHSGMASSDLKRKRNLFPTYSFQVSRKMSLSSRDVTGFTLSTGPTLGSCHTLIDQIINESRRPWLRICQLRQSGASERLLKVSCFPVCNRTSKINIPTNLRPSGWKQSERKWKENFKACRRRKCTFSLFFLKSSGFTGLAFPALKAPQCLTSYSSG